MLRLTEPLEWGHGWPLPEPKESTHEEEKAETPGESMQTGKKKHRCKTFRGNVIILPQSRWKVGTRKQRGEELHDFCLLRENRPPELRLWVKMSELKSSVTGCVAPGKLLN